MTGAVIASIFDDITEWLDDVSSSPWFLLVILVIAFLDSVIPIVPSETAVILGGVAAGEGSQTLALVIAAGAIGAFLGDNTAYMIGHRMSGRLRRRADHKPKFAARLAWADTQIRRRGGLILITARFIPGGRTALTISSGITRQPRVWFASWIVVAALIWASYAATLGYVFGEVVEDNETVAFLAAFATALSITVVIELVRNRLSRRKTGHEAFDPVQGR
jgi:membrane-associated protein